jgi:hypothetical protein
MNDQDIKLFRAEIAFNVTVTDELPNAFTRAEVDAISEGLNNNFADSDFCLTSGGKYTSTIFEDVLSHFQVLDVDGDDPTDPEARFVQEIPAEAVWVLYILADSGDTVEKQLQEAALIVENNRAGDADLAVSIEVGDMRSVQVMEMTPADKELLDLDEWSDCIPYHFGERFSGNDTCEEWLEGRAQFGRM